MAWEIEFTDQAKDWIESLDSDDYDSLAGVLDLLEQLGPALGRPAADAISGWYERNIPIADDRYDEYLAELEAEGLI